MRTRKPITNCIASGFTECSGRQESNDYCSKHYNQIRKRGSVFVTRFDRRPATITGATAKIPLGIGAKSGYAIVDANDSWVDKHNWSLASTGYAQTRHNGSTLLMHMLILGKKDGLEIDHININRLDNRRSNLRHVTHGENMYNLPLAKNNTSGIRGVDYDRRRGRWRAQIQKNGRNKFIGHFDSIMEAAKARMSVEETIFTYASKTK